MTAGSNMTTERKPRAETAPPSSVAAYIDCMLDACEILPAGLVPHMTQARLLDVQFCALKRRLEDVLAGKSDLNSADGDDAVAELLVALQNNADLKLQCVEEVSALLTAKLEELEACDRDLDGPQPTNGVQQQTPTVAGKRWNIVPRNADLERRPVSRSATAAAAAALDAQQNFQPNFGQNLSVAGTAGGFIYSCSASQSESRETTNRPLKRRRTSRKLAQTGGNNTSNDSKTESVSRDDDDDNNARATGTPAAGDKQADQANCRSASEAPSLAGSSHGSCSRRGGNPKRRAQAARLPSPKGPAGKQGRKGVQKEKERDKYDDSDADEETYCFCEQISYGDMICCDYDRCVIEWFHFGCVGVSAKPKGRWYCPNCRGDKPTVLKPSLAAKK